jgi:hypothetical protein
MNPIQVTAYGLKAIIRLLLGHTPDADPKSTVNERLDILGTARPTNNEKVRLGVLIAGNKGHRYVPGEEGIALTSIQDHTATNASLYGPMPLCVRSVDDDLSKEMRDKYCLRKENTLNGLPVYEYYGMWVDIDPEDVNVIMRKITREPNQPPVIEIFHPDTEDLYPTPIALPTTGAVTTTDVSISCSAVLTVTMPENILEEFINSAKLKYNGDERYAVLSEFALCLSAQRTVSINTTSGQANFLESIGTQIYNFAMDHKAVYYNTQELTIDFDIGNQIPLLGTQSIPTMQTIGVTVP